MTRQFVTHLSGFSLDGGLETVVESSGHVLQVSHSTGTGSSSSLSLQSPVVRSHLGSWVATRSTGFLLSVERTTAASLTQNVRLSVSLTHRWSTLWYVSNGRKPADRQRWNKNLNLNLNNWQNLNNLNKTWTAWKWKSEQPENLTRTELIADQKQMLWRPKPIAPSAAKWMCLKGFYILPMLTDDYWWKFKRVFLKKVREVDARSATGKFCVGLHGVSAWPWKR